MGGQNSKVVDLGKVIGIGGEGIVLEKELEVEIMQGTAKNESKKAENIRLKSKERSITAIKFVRDLNANENFQGKGFKRDSEVSFVRVTI